MLPLPNYFFIVDRSPGKDQTGKAGLAGNGESFSFFIGKQIFFMTVYLQDRFQSRSALFSCPGLLAVPDVKCAGYLAEVLSERQIIVNYGFFGIDIDFIACKWIIPVYLPVNPSVHEAPFLIIIIKHRGVPVVFPYKFQNSVGDMPGIAPVDYKD